MKGQSARRQPEVLSVRFSMVLGGQPWWFGGLVHCRRHGGGGGAEGHPTSRAKVWVRALLTLSQDNA